LRSAAGLGDQLSCTPADTRYLGRAARRGAPMGNELPRIKPYNVAAVFEMACRHMTRAMVFCALPPKAGLFQPNKTFTADRGVPPNTDRSTLSKAGPRRRSSVLVDWRQRNSTFFNAPPGRAQTCWFDQTMIVLVARLNIVSGLIMLVKEKGSDTRSAPPWELAGLRHGVF